jgi:hypothetical protein
VIVLGQHGQIVLGVTVYNPIVQRDAGSATMESMPRYLQVAGVALVAFGVLNRASYFLAPSGSNFSMSGADVAFNIVGSTLCLFGGLGLLFRRRWGWSIGLLLAVVNLSLSVLALAAPNDIAFPGGTPIAVILLMVPGILLLVGLLSPRTLRWLRRRETPGMVS